MNTTYTIIDSSMIQLCLLYSTNKNINQYYNKSLEIEGEYFARDNAGHPFRSLIEGEQDTCARFYL